MTFRAIGLRAAGWQRVESAWVPFGPGLNLVGGENGEGKTSTVRALRAALGDRDAIGDRPVHDGSEAADVEIPVAGPSGALYCTIRLHMDAGADKPSLSVKDPAGKRMPGDPATLIRGMVGAGIVYDPTALVSPNGEVTREGRDRRRMEVLLRACPLSIDLAQHEAARKVAFDDRRDAARDAKRLAAEVGEEVPADEGLPNVPSGDGLRAVLADMRATNKTKATARVERERILSRASSAVDDVERLRREWAQADQLAARLNADHAAHVQAHGSTIVDEDTSATEASLAAISESSRVAGLAAQRNAEKARRRRERDDKAKAAATAAAESERLTAELARLDAVKSAALAAANLPAGLSIGDEGQVLLGGQPFESEAESGQYTAALAVGERLCGPLRLLTFRSGDALGNAAVLVVKDWCERRGAQVVMERRDAVEGVDRTEIVEGRTAGTEST